jgi:hypothetical protein
MMSDNAMHIVFSSPAGDLVPGDTNGVQDIFVKSGDDDFDNVPDETDNCPNWSNASQGMPAWPVASDDPDCDGTGSVTEADLGTDTEKQCPATTALNDELVDAWPPDFNDNGITNMADVVMVGPKLNEPVRDQETRRFDLNVNDVVSLGDIVLMGAYFNRVCS